MTALDPREELAKRLGLAEIRRCVSTPPRTYCSDSRTTTISVTTRSPRSVSSPIVSRSRSSWRARGTANRARARRRDAVGARLIRLQCYEGLDDSKALYEWNYRSSCCASRPVAEATHRRLGTARRDIFGEEFLLTRPLLEAISATDPVVLLIDEVDRVELETEALLSRYFLSIRCRFPSWARCEQTDSDVFLTSNNTRELSEPSSGVASISTLAIRRSSASATSSSHACPHHDTLPNRSPSREVAAHARFEESTSVAETLDWARTLVVLGRSRSVMRTGRDPAHLVEVPDRHRTRTKELLGRPSPVLNLLATSSANFAPREFRSP